MDYKDTVHLPKTDFPMKANLPQREPEILRAWEEEGVFEKMVERAAARPGSGKFVLHDGPPYANGDIHIGHALNKILKDIIVKYHAMKGEVADYVPGWDCHGLPIELKVDKELGSKKKDLSRADVILECRRYALKWINKQREQFKRLGVFGRWSTPYLTMSRGYEAEIVRTVARAAEQGYLYRGKKPVYWCITDRTALAEAEVEYADHTSPSIHVAFDLVSPLPGGKLPGRKPRLVIWTTTPWTLPANLAVAAHPDLAYVAYDLRGQVVVVAKDLLAAFLAAVAPDELVPSRTPVPHTPLAHEAATGGGGVPPATLAHPERVLATFEGKELEGLRYQHPFMPRECPVILGEHVTLEAGTGLVHTAPGHGQEDYEVGLRYRLEVLNPVDGAGKFTAEAGPYAGQRIFDANQAIVADLHASGHLLSDPKATLRHSYPHCWRCHNPVVFRATDQWFLSLEHAELRRRTLEEIADRVQWIPRWGSERISNMIAHRPDWCLSRQRTWGVPIPVFYCEACDEPLVSAEVMRRVADAFAQEGIEAWYTHEPAELAGGARCGKCGGDRFRREQDILDVWWDSGVSWAAVAAQNRDMGVPVDLYLEGSDQHRGWFHSSLLTAMAVRGGAPYRAVLTHGFVLDAQGRAMSKSVGNTVSPDEITKKYGADILRLWVASTDYRDDVRVGDEILAGLAEGYRKIRNTIRWALGNLDGFDPARHAVAVEAMEPIDRWAVARLAEWVAKVKQAYADYEFHLAYHATIQLCAVELSSQYFDVIKDRLYTARKDAPARRSAQTALHLVAGDLTRMLAPVLSFTAEEAWGFLPEPPDAESVFYAGFPDRPRPADAAALEARYGGLFEARVLVQKALEEARKAKRIGSGLEAKITFRAAPALLERLRASEAELATVFIVSQVALEPSAGAESEVVVAPAAGVKCARCWGYYEDVGRDARHPTLCAKCAAALA